MCDFPLCKSYRNKHWFTPLLRDLENLMKAFAIKLGNIINTYNRPTNVSFQTFTMSPGRLLASHHGGAYSTNEIKIDFVN